MANNFIKSLVTQKFDVFNVDSSKKPVNKKGNKMGEWQSKTYDELVAQHNYNSKLWGMRVGKQTNDRHILSLDFDIYDKSADGDCVKTKELLMHYLNICQNKNGLYSSSTEGNMNVLVDYTKSPSIIELVEKLGKTKFNIHGLEILLRQNQVIPPSQTICKRKKKLGNPRIFENPDEPFYIIDNEEDCTLQFIKKLFEDEFSETKPKKGVKDSKVFETSSDTTEGNVSISSDASSIKEDEDANSKDKYLNLLFDVIKNGKDLNGGKLISWDIWFQIAGILKDNGYDYSIFQKYSNLFDEKNDALNLWKGLKKQNKMKIHGLQSIAKQINPQGYKEWMIKWNAYLHLEILDKGENDIARFISPYLIQSLKLCHNEWWVFKEKTSLWCRIKEPSATIITFIQIKINEALECCLSTGNRYDLNEDQLKELNKKKGKYMEHYKNVCKGSCCSQLIKFSKDYLCDDGLLELLDNGLYKMIFQNGVLDLTTLKFRNGIKKEDYVTKTIPFDYEKPNDNDVDYVKHKLKQICNWNDEHLNYYLSILGYAFTGDSSKEQNFYYLRGQTAENGKSVIFEILEVLMPNIVMKGNSDVLDRGADLRKEVATWTGLKILWLNEVSVKEKDEDLVKAVCDGTSYKYNRLYATEAVVMPVTFKLFAVSNNTLSIKGDAGVKRRFKLTQHNSQFKDDYIKDDYEKLQFIKDKDLKSKLLGKYKNALIYLIMTYSNQYWLDKKLKEYPKEWEEEAKEAMDDNDQFSEWFKEHFEICKEGKIHKNVLEEELKYSPHKSLKIKDELKRMKIWFKYDSQEQHYQKLPLSEYKAKKFKGFWTGFSMIGCDMFGKDIEE